MDTDALPAHKAWWSDFNPHPYKVVPTKSFLDESLRNPFITPSCIVPSWLHDQSEVVVESRPDSIHISDVDPDDREIFPMCLSGRENLTSCDPETSELNSSHFSLSSDDENFILGIPTVRSVHHKEADTNLPSLASDDNLHRTGKRPNNEERQQDGSSKRRRLDSTYSSQNDVKIPFNSSYRTGQNGRGQAVLGDNASRSRRDARRIYEKLRSLGDGDAVHTISKILSREAE